MSGWNTSPIDELIQDSLELSDGLKVDNGMLKCPGTDGGFIDNFDGSSLDTNNWLNYNNAIISNGALLLSGGTVDGWNKDERYVASRLISNSSQATLFGGCTTVKIKIENDNTTRRIRVHFEPEEKPDQYPQCGFEVTFYTDNHCYMYDYSQFARSGYTFETSEMETYSYLYLRFKAISNRNIQFSFKFDNNAWNIEKKFVGWSKGYLQLQLYHKDTFIKFDYVHALGYPTSETATLPESEVYTAQLPAKLAYVSSVAPTFVSAGNGGKVNFLVQRMSDWDDEWTSLSGELSGWTDLGELADGVKLYFPEYFSGPNEKLRYKLIYTGSGLDSYPEISKFTFEWQSDVTAPDDPEITVATSAANSVAVITFKEIPVDAYAIKFDLKVNDGSFLPFSERGKLETSYGYMRFVGHKDSKENASERNTLTVAIDGLVSGDIVTPRIYAIDQQENQSAGLIGTPIEITSAKYYPKLADKWSGRWPDLSWKGRWID